MTEQPKPSSALDRILARMLAAQLRADAAKADGVKSSANTAEEDAKR